MTLTTLHEPPAPSAAAPEGARSRDGAGWALPAAARRLLADEDLVHNVRVLLRGAAAAALTAVAGLFLWSVATLPLGWTSNVVMTGSMMPRIHPGDVVLVQPWEASDFLLGRVTVFRDPSEPDRILVHRFVEKAPGGGWISRGDANQSADTAPVQASDVIGLARLRVPYVGILVVWLHQGRYLELGAATAALAAACALVMTRPEEDEPDAVHDGADEAAGGDGDEGSTGDGARRPDTAHAAAPAANRAARRPVKKPGRSRTTRKRAPRTGQSAPAARRPKRRRRARVGRTTAGSEL
ncbi:hypothetical protein NUM3379_41830 [Kineococcus sp. NUM-3379]